MKKLLITSMLFLSCSYNKLITEINNDKLPDPCFKIIKEISLDDRFKEVTYKDTCD